MRCVWSVVADTILAHMGAAHGSAHGLRPEHKCYRTWAHTVDPTRRFGAERSGCVVRLELHTAVMEDTLRSLRVSAGHRCIFSWAGLLRQTLCIPSHSSAISGLWRLNELDLQWCHVRMNLAQGSTSLIILSVLPHQHSPRLGQFADIVRLPDMPS